MYDPAAAGAKLGRDSGSDLQMFGLYIANNISIGFRTFAGGLLAGVGSLLVLVFNGVMFGTVAAHLQGIGHGGPFWRLVVGHAAPELSAIVVARSEEHTSALQSLIRISYAVFCLKKQNTK